MYRKYQTKETEIKKDVTDRVVSWPSGNDMQPAA